VGTLHKCWILVLDNPDVLVHEALVCSCASCNLKLTAVSMQAFILYEEAIPDSKAEITTLQSIVGTLHKCRVFAAENRDVLVHKATGYSAKLLKKADQCRAVCTCSHLFWQEEVSRTIP